MNDPIVTVIIATYNRPDVLKSAIKSVVEQTFERWKLYVIGDHCDERTAKVIDSFSHDRIHYINLEERFGEQSGPHTVGLALSITPYVAFLNHDDIWLHDHLKSGLDILEEGKHDFFVAGTAFSRYSQNEPGDDFELYVDEINTRSRRSPFDFFSVRSISSFEPAGSWIIKLKDHDELRHWNHYTSVYRTPIEDYLMRAWKDNCSFYFAKKVTVWCVITHYKNAKAEDYYNYTGPEHQEIESVLAGESSDGVRKWLDNSYDQWNQMTESDKNVVLSHFNVMLPIQQKMFVKVKRLFKTLFLNPITAYFYKWTGLDIHNGLARLLLRQRGFRIKRMIELRTQKALVLPDVFNVIERVKQVHTDKL